MSLANCGPECEKALREIERFLDGECDAAVKHFVESHLSDCHPCMERAEFRRHVKDLIGEKCREDSLPAGLETRVTALIRGLGDPSV